MATRRRGAANSRHTHGQQLKCGHRWSLAGGSRLTSTAESGDVVESLVTSLTCLRLACTCLLELVRVWHSCAKTEIISGSRDLSARLPVRHTKVQGTVDAGNVRSIAGHGSFALEWFKGLGFRFKAFGA